MPKTIVADVAVIGGGVTGLFLTKMLSEVGFTVVLVEKADELAGGPSTRNEGWLHSGAYHVAAILDRTTAVQVARRVKFGYDYVRSFAEDVIEERDSLTFALVEEDEVSEVTSRWDEAEVMYVPISRTELDRLAPQIVRDGVARAFKVPDVSINTRRLYDQLARRAQALGAKLYTSTSIDSIEECGRARLRLASGRLDTLECRLYIYAAGFGIKEIFESQFDKHINLRCWVSHLLDVPRLMKHGAFYLARQQATIMHHGKWSIVGNNGDQIPVDVPPSQPDETIVEQVKYALRRLVKSPNLTESRGRACVKIDVDAGQERSSGTMGDVPPQLNLSCGEPLQNHIWVLPGKMTEAPSLADFLTDFVRQRLGEPIPTSSTSVSPTAPSIARRPIDTYDLTESRTVETASTAFDVFLSHNSQDKSIVRQIFDGLVSREIRPWLDERELVPGRPWQDALEEIIKNTRTAVVMFGPTGLGPWEEPEMRACLSQFVDRKLPVIPVLLPGAPQRPKLPLFLEAFKWVDLRGGIDRKGLDKLVWGITGVKPGDERHPEVHLPKWTPTAELLIGRLTQLEALDEAWSNYFASVERLA